MERQWKRIETKERDRTHSLSHQLIVKSKSDTCENSSQHNRLRAHISVIVNDMSKGKKECHLSTPKIRTRVHTDKPYVEITNFMGWIVSTILQTIAISRLNAKQVQLQKRRRKHPKGTHVSRNNKNNNNKKTPVRKFKAKYNSQLYL